MHFVVCKRINIPQCGMFKKSRTFWVVIAVALATAVALLLALNFSAGEKKINQQLPKLYSASDPQFMRAMGGLLGPGIVGGNQVQELLNGDQIFPSMLQAIRSATKTITFETYIYWSGNIGSQFADALAERAQAGVKVHVLMDWVGSGKMEDTLLKKMESAGVDVRKFHKPAWYNMARLNNRTHRKLLVVDGAVGFTGGVGIAPTWEGAAQDADHWRDSHFRVTGPVVSQMQATFMDNWIKVSGQVLHGEPYFPTLEAAGTSLAQMFFSSPSSGSDNMALMYHLALTSAEKTVDLSMAYFVPDDLSQQILMAAVKRGVRVRLITPGPITDTQTVRSASRQTWGPLLAAGAEIYEFLPTMYHCKVMIVDNFMVSVGSTNFDSRSFRLNDEANLNVYDIAMAARQSAIFEDDLKRSRRVTYVEWTNRPLEEKAKDWITSLLSSQL